MSVDTFKRYEIKFILNQDQKSAVFERINEFMCLNNLSISTIRNVYYDTENFYLIRKSIEKPAYKEKLRIRSYNKVLDYELVFVELKKKYDGIVYKRRCELANSDATSWLEQTQKCKINTQITKEIDYVIDFYKTLMPKVFISYDRKAYIMKDKTDFRVTFDSNILYRFSDLSLTCDIYGENLLSNDLTLMEVKCRSAIPLWFAKILSQNKIYKTSFSKYGKVYENFIKSSFTNEKEQFLT